MTEMTRKTSEAGSDSMKITVTKNGPYIVTGGVPLTTEEICNDNEGYCYTWRPAKKYPLQDEYALCRCGNSKNKPFCYGTHTKIHFDGTESGDRVPYRKGADVIRGPALTLTDNGHLCVHARACGPGESGTLYGNPETRQRGIPPSGRLATAPQAGS